MSVVPELEPPQEAFKEGGSNNDVAVDGKTKHVVDVWGGHAGGEVVAANNSSEEGKASREEVFKEGPSEKGNLDGFDEEDDDRNESFVIYFIYPINKLIQAKLHLSVFLCGI